MAGVAATDVAGPAMPPAPSAWSPFGRRAFALLWTATLVSNVGTWMHDVGAGWLMTTLAPSPAMVAFVQSATTAPIFLFALFAGALADRIDKRRFLIQANAALLAVVAAMAMATAAGLMTPPLLLAFTFLIGAGAAFVAPAWQAVVPQLVPRPELQAAIALNSMGINISRAIGPALAGALIVAVGLAAPFAVNAASFLVIIAALLMWRPPAQPRPTLPPEPIAAAMLTGLRHVAHNPPMKATLARSVGYFLFASAFWALLPLAAKGLPGGGAALYGVLLGAVGAGAVGGALLMPAIRKRIDANRLAAGGAVITAAAMALLGLAAAGPVAVAAALLGGVGWIIVLTSLNVSAQTALPDWVRARGLAVSLMTFFGCMALGAALWGQIAQATSIAGALSIAAAGALLAIPLTWRARLGQGEGLDLAPATSWADPVVAPDAGAVPDRGPVVVSIRYEIPMAATDAFLAALHEVADERRRDGAYRWGVYQDASEPRFWTELFYLPSWAEHLRQHERATVHDADAHARARAFHAGEGEPVVSHLLAPAQTAAGALPHDETEEPTT